MSEEAELDAGCSSLLKSKDESCEVSLGLGAGDALDADAPPFCKRWGGKRVRIWRTRASALSSLSSTSVRCLYGVVSKRDEAGVKSSQVKSSQVKSSQVKYGIICAHATSNLGGDPLSGQRGARVLLIETVSAVLDAEVASGYGLVAL